MNLQAYKGRMAAYLHKCQFLNQNIFVVCKCFEFGCPKFCRLVKRTLSLICRLNISQDLKFYGKKNIIIPPQNKCFLGHTGTSQPVHPCVHPCNCVQNTSNFLLRTPCFAAIVLNVI